ncbi:molybdopterin-dependent oxidoreductase [Acidisoma cellulosilytica]|uniref:Molybdopterin-dependent oxidoreductase n=1 Tax=Acidisoma cellulosilyticum TaxID=2802395 RepID=A0A964E1V8_9PROT|nr:molybdopterin cofactor-binding domain-containing protein [Acidisoma cellulosilyticum]MCB8878761.1 molybdopterin-dependent oxidoreductase [Acidisoma cellulosilyticum]
MTEPRTTADYLATGSQLAVVRDKLGATSPDDVEIFVIVSGDGRVTAFNGHVDLGTGIGTALGQIVAEELDVAFPRVTVVLGDTERTPNQGPTIASETIQISAKPLARAAATARAALLARAAERLAVPVSDLSITDGVVTPPVPDNRALSYGDLIGDDRIILRIDPEAPLKPVADYRVVGQKAARVDLPAKATGGLVYVHDVRVPDMLHGHVVRPPYAGVDVGDFVGTSLIGVDQSSIADLPGILAVVVIGDFIGIVAEREEQAARAAERLRVTWKPIPHLRDLTDIPTALRENPSTPRELSHRGDVEAVRAAVAQPMDRTYVWPYHLHGSIGPSCTVADFRADKLTLWSGTQNPHMLRADLAKLMGMDEGQIDIIRLQAAGCYGRNCADDVGGDAALLSRAVGRPVRVQLTREQETAWEPKGTAQLMEVRGGLDAAGDVASYDFSVRYPSNGAPLLASLLTGVIPPVPMVFTMGDRTAIPPYSYGALRATAHDMAPIVRASWLRGVSSMPNSFAHESWIDEAASVAKVDPIAYRLRYLHDPRAVDLVKAMADRVDWVPHTEPGTLGGEGDILRGRGFAYAVYVHGQFPGVPAAWSAWVADVEVNKTTGDVALTKITVGQDSGLMINPAGVQHQIHGNVIQSISRVLKEEVTFNQIAVETKEWGGYPMITFPEIPPIDVLMMDRQQEPPLGVGESASVPSAAAIANAIYDATGVRFRELPFTPERVRAGLEAAGITSPPAPMALPAPPPAKKRGLWAGLGLGLAGLVGIGTLALPIRSAMAPIAGPDPTLYSASTIARGKMLAALGDCAVCHTAEGGQPMAGGLPLETPFGTIFSTNLTPDVQTGIGTWSFDAFKRAMRQGIGQDGQHLYPVFPYDHFTKTTDEDLEAIYAYLMAQTPVVATIPANKLAFPMNIRPLMAGWNALYLKTGAYQPDPARSADWNRGAYLVEGLGHCSSCHTPRNALGAEIASQRYAGGVAEGWEAPALSSLSRAPIPWSEGELFTYLRTGFSPLHGPAAGPMAPVIHELQALPDSDLRAMAHYLASDLPPVSVEAEKVAIDTADARNAGAMLPSAGPGGRIFQGACAVCHAPTAPPLFGVKPNLAFNSNLQSASPDNLIRTILGGVPKPAVANLGPMPGFGPVLSDSQIADLVRFLRRQYAPGQPEWADLDKTISRLRATAFHAGP